MTDYPEHEKMQKIKDQSQAIGEFLEWLPEKGIHLAQPMTKKLCPGHSLTRTCRSGRAIDSRGEEVGQCRECGGTGEVDRIDPLLVPASYSIQRLLAEFFEIDLDKIEAEKRAMLEALRTS